MPIRKKSLNIPSNSRILALSFLNANTSNGAQTATQGATLAPIASSDITNLSSEVITKRFARNFPFFNDADLVYEKSIELSFDLSGSAYNSFLTDLALSALPITPESVSTGVNQSGDYNVQIGVVFDSVAGVKFDSKTNEIVDFGASIEVQGSIQIVDNVTGLPSLGIAWDTENWEPNNGPQGGVQGLYGAVGSLFSEKILGETIWNSFITPNSGNSNPVSATSPGTFTVNTNQQRIMDLWVTNVATPETFVIDVWPPGQTGSAFDPIPDSNIYQPDILT